MYIIYMNAEVVCPHYYKDKNFLRINRFAA